jgi:hypothetical protein
VHPAGPDLSLGSDAQNCALGQVLHLSKSWDKEGNSVPIF